MSRLPTCSGREVIAALRRLGFVEAHRKGSHVTLSRSRSDHVDVTVVTDTPKDVPRGTLGKVLRLARVSREELLEAL